MLPVLLLGACKSTHFVPDEQFLLQKNKVHLTSKSTIDEEELSMYVKQKPNKAILLNSWRIYLTSYNFLHRKKDDMPDYQHKKHGLLGRLRLKSI